MFLQKAPAGPLPGPPRVLLGLIGWNIKRLYDELEY